MLSSHQIGRFRDQGFLSGLAVSTPVEADGYRARFDTLEAREGREKCRIGLIDRHHEEPFILEIATLPALLDAVESIIGPDIRLLATHFFCKYGPEERFVAWHQDVTYWGIEPPEALTAWFAVDASDTGNGCMRVIPGSHLGGVRHHGKSAAEGNLLSINQEVPVTTEEESSAVDLVLAPGQISLHDGALIHGSLPNRSTRRRCGLTLRYIRPEVHVVDLNSTGKPWNPVPVRGQGTVG